MSFIAMTAAAFMIGPYAFQGSSTGPRTISGVRAQAKAAQLAWNQSAEEGYEVWTGDPLPPDADPSSSTQFDDSEYWPQSDSPQYVEFQDPELPWQYVSASPDGTVTYDAYRDQITYQFPTP